MAKSKATSQKAGKSSRPPKKPSSRTGRDKAPASLDRLLAAVRSDPEDIKAVLALGNYYNDNRMETKIIEAVEPLEKIYPFPDKYLRGLYNRLLAIGYSHLGRFVDSEKAVLRGLEEYPHSLDFYYVLCFLKLSLREYDDAIQAAQKYISLREKINGKRLKVPEFSSTGAHATQLYNFLGVALREKEEFDEAERAFREAIAADRGNHLPYINLSQMLVQWNKMSSAREVVGMGMKKCRQVQELRMLMESFDKRVSVSACLMVKDEEELLPGCLESIRDWVDEIIVVDTGSTDRTMEIARSYGARIFHQPWEGNFSKHRNYSIEQATGDWIFIIDADERICQEDVPQLLRLLSHGNSSIIAINVYNVYRDKNQSVTFLPSERLFHRDLNLRYEGIVHNQLKLPPDIPIIKAGVKLQHLGYDLSPEKMQKKMARSRTLLEKQLQENPDNAFTLFNLAQLYRSGYDGFKVEHAPLVLKWAARAVELTDPANLKERHIHLMCLDQLAWTNFYIEDYKRALDYCRRALDIKPDYLDPLLLLGHIHSQERQLSEAKEAYLNYLKTQAVFDASRETESIILIHPDSRANAYYSLGLLAEMQNDYNEARKYYLETLKVNPDFLEANTLVGKIYLRDNNFLEAEKYFLRQMATPNVSREAAQGLGYIYNIQKNYPQAENYYQQAMKIAPDDPVTLSRYGEFCLETGREEEALELFKKARLVGNPAENIEKRIAGTYLKTGRFEEAIKLYKQVLKQNRETAEILNDLGNCYYKLGFFREAEEYYIRTLELEAGYTVAYRNRGLTRARLNKSKEAIADFEKYLQLCPDQYEIFHIIGDLYSKIGQYQKAIGYYEKFLGFKPYDSLAMFNLSECYLNMGHRDSAIMGYRRVLQIEPDFKPARQRLDNFTKIEEKV
ncbi:MAG: tetratricopeptide repeat protein [candidate division Zixibacteria bacterium]|nr:tetratricopeptide repeat protein [candidate division Zixibacteria bacterium]MDD5425925.1 tetratricopeptide repeat protein [candidate division Zixibacteria bacterium]